jgi:GTP cyclohydrolase III
MHQHHFIQQIDLEYYSCMPWKGFPATRRESLINTLKRKYFSNADRVFTENINAKLAYFKIKKSI